MQKKITQLKPTFFLAVSLLAIVAFFIPWQTGHSTILGTSNLNTIYDQYYALQVNNQNLANEVEYLRNQLALCNTPTTNYPTYATVSNPTYRSVGSTYCESLGAAAPTGALYRPNLQEVNFNGYGIQVLSTRSLCQAASAAGVWQNRFPNYETLVLTKYVRGGKYFAVVHGQFNTRQEANVYLGSARRQAPGTIPNGAFPILVR